MDLSFNSLQENFFNNMIYFQLLEQRLHRPFHFFYYSYMGRYPSYFCFSHDINLHQKCTTSLSFAKSMKTSECKAITIMIILSYRLQHRLSDRLSQNVFMFYVNYYTSTYSISTYIILLCKYIQTKLQLKHCN